MADSVGSLYMSLGLDLSELETGLVAVDRTVNENVRRLNRQADLIQLRAEIEIAGLDEVADAERILEIRQRALNDQMAAQRDRVRLLDAELRRLTEAHGADSVAVERATIRLERERLALANLERDLRGLNGSTEESSSIFDELSDMLPEIPTKFQAIGIAASAITAGIGAAATAVQDLLEQFRELQNQSYELNMSLPDTKQFLRQVKLGGGDIGDIEGYIRGITDAYVKGEYDDPEFIALRKYGAQITDATGRLKEFKDITDEVYRAWEKADAAGEGIEFLQLTGGESGVRDIIQYFQRLKEAREDAAQIVNADINTDQLHELDRAFGRLEEQSSELKAAIGDIFVPAAQAAVEKLFDTVRDGTQTLVENKDTIQRWGFIVAETFSTVSDKIGDAFSAIGDYFNEAVEVSRNTSTGDIRVDKMLEGMSWRYGTQTGNSPTGNFQPWANFYEASQSYGAFESVIRRAEERQRAYNAGLSETKTVSDVAAKGLEALSDEVKDNGNVLSQYGSNRIKEFKDELEDLQVELDFGDNDYAKAMAQQDLWLKRELNDKLLVSEEERKAIEALDAARRELINRDRDDKITDELRPQNYEERLKLIEQEKQKFIEAGMEEAEAYSQAQDAINSKFKTSLDERIAGYNRDKEEWIKQGMDRADAEELTQQRIDKARQDYADKLQQHYQNANDTLFNATHSAYERELRDIERLVEEARKRGETEEEVSAMVAEAAAKEAAAIEREVDRIKKANQSLEDKIYAQEHSQYEVDRRKLQQEVAELYKNGASRDMIQRYYNNALNDLNAKAAKGGDYTKAPRGGGDIQIIDFGQQRQSDIGIFTDERKARQSVISSLTEEQRKRLDEAGVLDKVIAAQTSLANSTEQAADNIQDASKIEIIHGDEIEGGEFSTPEMPSLDDLLAGVIPTNEFRDLQTQTQEVTTAQSNLTDATDNVTSAEKNLSDATKDATAANKNLSDAASKAHEALKNFSENASKVSGLKRDDTDVPTKMPTKSAPTDSEQSKPEKVNLQVKPKDKDFLKLSDLGFDYDTAKDVFLTGAGLAATSASTGIGLAFSPKILAASVIAALAGGVTKGTIDNRSERLNAPENLPLDAGEFANIDLSEFSTPLSSIESNVQGIRDILQGKNAVDDANAEALPDTSTETAPDLLTPLTNISEIVQNILGELQNRQDDESTNAISELQSEVSTQLSDVATQMSEGASQVSESITSPIESLSQALSEIQTQNAEQGTAESEGTTYLENVASTVQSIWDDMQAAKETETADTTDTDDTAAKLANIDTNVAAIWQKLSEETTETPTETPQDSELSRLATIDNNVATILQDLQATKEVEGTDETANLANIDTNVATILQSMQEANSAEASPLANIDTNVSAILQSLQETAAREAENALNTLLEPLQRIDSPLSSITQAIADKEVTIQTETIVQPLNNIAGLIDKILSALVNREPPKIDISPNMDIDLGGAYVFDNEMKQSLVDDITSNIVSRITEAVERATSQVSSSSYAG